MKNSFGVLNKSLSMKTRVRFKMKLKIRRHPRRSLKETAIWAVLLGEHSVNSFLFSPPDLLLRLHKR